MSYGLEIRNGNGNLAITDTTFNYHYIGSASAYSTFIDSSSYVNLAWYTLTSTNKPMVFIEPTGTNRFNLVAITNVGGTSWRVLISYTTAAPRIHGFAMLTNSTPNGNSGLVIYKTDGNLAFDSNRKPLSLNKITSYSVSNMPGSYSGSSLLEGFGKTVSLGTLPSRAAFCYQTAGSVTSYLSSNNGYNIWYNTLYRDGSNFGNIWRRAEPFIYSPQSGVYWEFQDNSAKPLFVVDAAKYD